MHIEPRDNGRRTDAVARSSVLKEGWGRGEVKPRVARIVRLMIEWRRGRWNRIQTRSRASSVNLRGSPRVHPGSRARPDNRGLELWDPPMGVCSQDLWHWRYPFYPSPSFRAVHSRDRRHPRNYRNLQFDILGKGCQHGFKVIRVIEKARG